MQLLPLLICADLPWGFLDLTVPFPLAFILHNDSSALTSSQPEPMVHHSTKLLWSPIHTLHAVLAKVQTWMLTSASMLE